MKTKAELIIFAKKLAGFQLHEMQLCWNKNLLWAKPHIIGFWNQMKTRHFGKKTKPYTNKKPNQPISSSTTKENQKKPVNKQPQDYLYPEVWKRKVHTFHLFLPTPAKREKGRVFLGSCSCCRCKGKWFSPKLDGALCAGTAMGKPCPPQLQGNSAWRRFRGPGVCLWVAKWSLGLAQPNHFRAVSRGFLPGMSAKD